MYVYLAYYVTFSIHYTFTVVLYSYYTEHYTILYYTSYTIPYYTIYCTILYYIEGKEDEWKTVTLARLIAANGFIRAANIQV